MTPAPEMQLFPAAALVLLWVLNWAGAGGQLTPAPCGHRDWDLWGASTPELPHSMAGWGQSEGAQVPGEGCVPFLEVTLNTPSMSESTLTREPPFPGREVQGSSTVCRA